MSPNLIAIIELQGAGWNLFYGVQGEPGGNACYYEVDAASSYCQILGHDNCKNGPLNLSPTLATLVSCGLSVNSVIVPPNIS
jgi:hypothetical protein